MTTPSFVILFILEVFLPVAILLHYTKMAVLEQLTSDLSQITNWAIECCFQRLSHSGSFIFQLGIIFYRAKHYNIFENT